VDCEVRNGFSGSAGGEDQRQGRRDEHLVACDGIPSALIDLIRASDRGFPKLN
jgi:hypothetical protein